MAEYKTFSAWERNLIYFANIYNFQKRWRRIIQSHQYLGKGQIWRQNLQTRRRSETLRACAPAHRGTGSHEMAVQALPQSVQEPVLPEEAQRCGPRWQERDQKRENRRNRSGGRRQVVIVSFYMKWFKSQNTVRLHLSPSVCLQNV